MSDDEDDSLDSDLADLVAAHEGSLKELAEIGGLDPRFDLCGADLRNANLAGQDLSKINLSGADLCAANLQACDLGGANLSRANLSRAKLSRAKLSDASLVKCNLTGANIEGLVSDNADLQDSILAGISDGPELRKLLTLRANRKTQVRQRPTRGPLTDDVWSHLHAMLRTVFAGRVLIDACTVWAIDDSPIQARSIINVGLTQPHLDARLDHASPLVEVLRSGQPLPGDTFLAPGDSSPARWYVPISLRRKVVGIMEVTQGKSDALSDALFDDRLPSYQELAVLLSAVWAEWLRLWTTQLLPTRLRRLPGDMSALEEAAFAARWATQATFAAIYLPQTLDPSGDWTLAATSGAGAARKLVRRQIDTMLAQEDAAAPDASGHVAWLSPTIPIRSLSTAAIEAAGEPIGILVAVSRDSGDFTDGGPSVLRAVADQVALLLGPTQRLVRSLDLISGATAELGRLDAMIREACVDLQERHKFAFVAFQMIKKSDNVIETVAGTGIAEEWVGCARHPLAKEFVLRDIQADIALSRQAEVISRSEEDGRMDRYLHEEFRHPDFTRVFVPMIVLRDRGTGRFAPAASDACRWEVDRRRVGARKYDYRLIIKHPDNVATEVIGTVEAGIKRSAGAIDEPLAIEVAQRVTLIARDIYRATLPYLLEKVLEAGCLAGRADSAALHFLRRRRGAFVPEIVHGEGLLARGSKEIGRRGHPPRKDGLGMRAIRKGAPQALGAGELERTNRPIYDEGVRSMLTIPLCFDDSRTGLLYLHYGHDRAFIEGEIQLVRAITDQAGSSVRLATSHAEIAERERLWRAVQKTSLALGTVVESFRSPAREVGPAAVVNEKATTRLVQAVAGNAVNILAADVVIIYEHQDNRIQLEPVWAGRLLREKALRNELGPDDIPYRAIQSGEDIFTSEADKHPLLVGRAKPGGNFVEREKIQSCAAIRLRSGNEIVGVMFVNYRRVHEFSRSETALIQLFASSAAMFLKHLRDLSDPQAGQRVAAAAAAARPATMVRALERLWNEKVKPSWEQYEPRGPLHEGLGIGSIGLGLLTKLHPGEAGAPPERRAGDGPHGGRDVSRARSMRRRASAAEHPQRRSPPRSPIT